MWYPPAPAVLCALVQQTSYKYGTDNSSAQLQSPYHIPDKVGQPVDHRLHTTDELQVFSLADPFLDKEDHKAGRNEGHGKDHTNGD